MLSMIKMFLLKNVLNLEKILLKTANDLEENKNNII